MCRYPLGERCEIDLIYYRDDQIQIHHADVLSALKLLPENSVHCVVTSPPYYALREYPIEPMVWGAPKSRTCDPHHWGDESVSPLRGRYCIECGAWKGHLGLEPTVAQFIDNIVEVFAEVRRVLHPSGLCWINMGDTYASAPNGRAAIDITGDDRTFRDKPITAGSGLIKPKDMCLIPERMAVALQDAGWWIRRRIVWYKPNAKPDSAKDRPGVDEEMIYLLSKTAKPYYDREAIKVKATDGYRYMRSVWELPTESMNMQRWGVKSVDHFAAFPLEIPRRCILLGTSSAGVCPKCLMPFKRVLNPSEEYAENFGSSAGDDASRLGKGHRKTSPAVSAVYETQGWAQTCLHKHITPTPATVLDPFSGTATTGEAAIALGRNYTGIELSEDYCMASVARLGSVTRPLGMKM